MLTGFFLYKKILYECSDEFWNRVKAYKRDRSLPSLNQAMTELIEVGLAKYEKDQAGAFNTKLAQQFH